MNSAYQPFIKAVGEGRVQRDVVLAPHTYFKLGGPADLFTVANTTEEIVKLVHAAITHQIPYFVLGGGSNILVNDKGYRGLIIKNRSSKLQLKGFTGQASKGRVDLKDAIVQADSGVPSNQLIRYTLDQGLSGLEDFLGLPGTVGGAIYNNSHHLGKLIGDLVIEVTALSRTGKLVKLSPRELKFDYDYSVFHVTQETILTASFLLKRGDKEALWEKANAAVKRRATTQPLGKPSSGCIFKNIPVADAMRIGTPDHNTSVGYLIDRAGLKGQGVGGAVVSDIHANFIVNDGTATAQDVLDLVEFIKQKIKAKYGVDLTEEIIILGQS